MPAPAPPASPARELLHTGMWTLLGLMGFGLVLVPILRPSIVWTSIFFGWSNVMVAYMVYRMVSQLRARSAGTELPPTLAPRVESYTYTPEPRDARAGPVRAEPPSTRPRDAEVLRPIEA